MTLIKKTKTTKVITSTKLTCFATLLLMQLVGLPSSASHPEDELLKGKVYDKTLTIRGQSFARTLEQGLTNNPNFVDAISISERPGPNGQNFIEVKYGFKTLFLGRLPLAMNRVENYSNAILPLIQQKLQNIQFSKMIKSPDLAKEEL